MDKVVKENRKLSRRDFIKASGVATLVLGGSSVVAGIELGVEYGNNPYSMATRVCNRLFEAELNKEKYPGEYEHAKKLAFIWLFAETARQHAKDIGYEKAGVAIGHYLYGEGQPLDVSKWIEDETKNIDFWKINLSDMKWQMKVDESVEEGLKQSKMLKNRLTSGYKYVGEGISDDIYYAIGRSTYVINASYEFKYDDELEFVHNESLTNILFEIRDEYDWDLDNPADLGIKGGYFASDLFSKIRDIMLLPSGKKIDDILNKLNLSRFQIDQLIDIYNNGINNYFRDAGQAVNFATQDLENTLSDMHGISEYEMGLLESVGAKRYRIYGRVYYPGKIELED